MGMQDFEGAVYRSFPTKDFTYDMTVDHCPGPQYIIVIPGFSQGLSNTVYSWLGPLSPIAIIGGLEKLILLTRDRYHVKFHRNHTALDVL